jgi:NADPH-dependent 2,4-dienoyl-CoA reductase/sulfur reductase-like enzyme
MRERLVVIGGDAAGMSAAARARRRRDPDELEIVAFERGRYTSYSACGIPYFVGDVVTDADRLVARTPEEHRRNGIDVRTRHEVVAVDVNRRRVRVRDLEAGAERDETFDQLVVATGAVPFRPDIPGIDADRIFGVQTLGDGVAVRQAIDEHAPRTAVVVGGGYIGLEMAEALVRRGLEVALFDRTEQPMAATFDDDIGALVADALRAVGVTLYMGEPVEAFDAGVDGRVRAVRTAQRTLAADVVILGTGVRPNSRLAEEAGIAIGATGGIVTDARMETSIGGVWAAGDCVESIGRVTGEAVVIPLGTHANKQGRVVGINATGGDARFPGLVGTAASKICAYEVARAGITERHATNLDLDVVAATIESTTRASYFPGAASITVKVIAARDGRIVGAQIVGEEGAAKRIDVLATAIWNRMHVDEIASLDLSYAPPFSPVWDPVLIAARKAADRL